MCIRESRVEFGEENSLPLLGHLAKGLNAMTEGTLPDGLEELRKELSLDEIMRLIERTARWVDPATFRLLPIWYPEHARRTHYYKKSWSEPQMNRNRQTGHTEHKREGNHYANKALTLALGLSAKKRPSWTCCHIWGVDDPKYQQANAVVQDHRFFSCVANMVLLPVPLKAFTDVMPEVKAMLRICARNLYGWHCDDESVATAVQQLDEWKGCSAYPTSWPKTQGTTSIPGLIKLNERIRRRTAARMASIRDDLENAGQFYPRDPVRAALKYWRNKMPDCTLLNNPPEAYTATDTSDRPPVAASQV